MNRLGMKFVKFNQNVQMKCMYFCRSLNMLYIKADGLEIKPEIKFDFMKAVEKHMIIYLSTVFNVHNIQTYLDIFLEPIILLRGGDSV